MQVSLRVPREINERLSILAEKTGKTKTALILEALEEKYALKKDRASLIRNLAGWMSKVESDALRNAVSDFDTLHDKDWP
jgi:predicted DNA-binding protein